MNYCTFSRFQGIWLGSIIGQALTNQNPGERIIVDNNQSQWLLTRDKIAEMIIEESQVSNITRQLVEILQNTEICLRNDAQMSSQAALTQDCNQFCLGNGSVENTLLKSGNKMLLMLPLIIFHGNDQDLFKEIVNQCDLKLAISQENIEYIEDLLLWSYLLTLALNNKLSSDTNVSLIVRQILTDALVKNTSLIAKLKTIVKAWEQGISLYQLSKLLSRGNLRQTAIALSIYCFATTPQDFRLSVKRAASLEPQIAWLTTALTATLSGAYNGIAGIPESWRAMVNQNSTYQSANQTVVKLFKAWLGVYLIDNDQFLYDWEFHAVATPKVIQHRPALRIISQKLF